MFAHFGLFLFVLTTNFLLLVFIVKTEGLISYFSFIFRQPHKRT